MAPLQPIKWYGYQHTNGTLHVKRYVGHFGPSDMLEVKASPFCVDVFGPFTAQNQHTAKKKLRKLVERTEENK